MKPPPHAAGRGVARAALRAVMGQRWPAHFTTADVLRIADAVSASSGGGQSFTGEKMVTDNRREEWPNR